MYKPTRGSTSRKDEKGDKCANCSKSVGEKEMGIQCEICSGWFHSKCVDISAEVYSFMEKNKNVHWYCDSCNKGVAYLIEEVSKMKLRQDLMDQSLKEMRSEIEELKIGITKTDTKLETAIEAKLLDVVERKLEHKVESKVDESMDIERRKYNLVVQGIKEDDGKDDEEIIDELMSSLHCAPRNIEEINRIGRKVDGRIRPVRMVMKSVEAKSEVLKRAKLLKGTSQFSRIFIQPDLTVNQQKADKELRVKLKEIRDQGEREAKIKNGKIIKNVENGEVITLYQPPAVNL